MNAAFLLLPLFLIRYLLLGLLSRDALSRASFFPKPSGRAAMMYWTYLLSEALLLICPFFFYIRMSGLLFHSGLCLYLFGVVIYIVATVSFTGTDGDGMTVRGLYKLSRNPMYVGFFFYFLGIAVLSRAIVLLLVLTVFQIATHWIIYAEEQWCLDQFGGKYRDYMKTVRRYF